MSIFDFLGDVVDSVMDAITGAGPEATDATRNLVDGHLNGTSLTPETVGLTPEQIANTPPPTEARDPGAAANSALQSALDSGANSPTPPPADPAAFDAQVTEHQADMRDSEAERGASSENFQNRLQAGQIDHNADMVQGRSEQSAFNAGMSESNMEAAIDRGDTASAEYSSNAAQASHEAANESAREASNLRADGENFRTAKGL